MPFVPEGLLAELRVLGEDADVVAPESGSSRRGLEPLCAYYSPACIAPIERSLDADDRRVIGFFDQVRVARLVAGGSEAIRRPGPPLHERQLTERARARGAICLDRRS